MRMDKNHKFFLISQFRIGQLMNIVVGELGQRNFLGFPNKKRALNLHTGQHYLYTEVHNTLHNIGLRY